MKKASVFTVVNWSQDFINLRWIVSIQNSKQNRFQVSRYQLQVPVQRNLTALSDLTNHLLASSVVKTFLP